MRNPGFLLYSLLAVAPVVVPATGAPERGTSPIAAGSTAEGLTGSPQDDQPCSCGGDRGSRAPHSPAVPQPSSDVSGVSLEGVYFIPEPLPDEEGEKDCTKEVDVGAVCPPGEPQGWVQPASYTASIVFTPGKGPHPEDPEAHKTLPEESKAPAVAEREGRRLEALSSLKTRVDHAFGVAEQQIQRALEWAGVRKRRENAPVPEAPCRRGRAPTHSDRRLQFLADYGADYSLQAEATAIRELKRLRGDIYLDYAGKRGRDRRL